MGNNNAAEVKQAPVTPAVATTPYADFDSEGKYDVLHVGAMKFIVNGIQGATKLGSSPVLKLLTMQNEEAIFPDLFLNGFSNEEALANFPLKTAFWTNVRLLKSKKPKIDNRDGTVVTSRETRMEVYESRVEILAGERIRILNRPSHIMIDKPVKVAVTDEETVI